jgi:hypothetical protein
MLDELFHNVGPKIRNFAKAAFVVESVAAILGGLALIIEDFEIETILMGIGIIVGGILAAYWTSVFIAGIGENIESTTAVKESNRQILAELKKLNQNAVVPTPASPAAPAIPVMPAQPVAPGEPEPTWTCHSCKTVNPVRFRHCTRCHATQAWSKQKSGIPAAPVQSADPAPVKPAAPTIKTQKGLYEHLVFASNYSTDEGMRAYLSRIAMDNLTPAEQNDLSALLAQESLRSAVQDYLKLYH